MYVERDTHLERLRKRQTELLEDLDYEYDEDKLRELNIINNRIEVAERRYKNNYITREVISPYRIETVHR